MAVQIASDDCRLHADERVPSNAAGRDWVRQRSMPAVERSLFREPWFYFSLLILVYLVAAVVCLRIASGLFHRAKGGRV